jgi:hypothetical protein
VLTLQQVTYERPPEGLARGRFPVPWWVILGIAVTLVIAAVVFLIVRGVVGWQLSKGPSKPPTT